MRRILTISLLVTFCLPMTGFSEDISLPEIKKPTILNEGTQRVLSAEQIAELMPWAKDSKFFLVDLLDNIGPLTTDDKIEKLVEGIKQVVQESAPKNSELLMRYVLNRALILNDLIGKEADSEAVGTKDVLIRTLISSIKMAITYYEIDMDNLKTPAKQSSFITFGMEYFTFLTELNKSIFDASAQYFIERTALEWFQWDLYRDLNNKMYAPQIVKINNCLKTFSTKKMSDAQAIVAIRQMKKIAEQLDVAETIRKIQLEERRIEDEKRLELLRTEKEIKAELARQKEERLAAIEKEKAEKLRGQRSLIVAEEVNVNERLLSSSEWTTRRDAVQSLSSIPGADVTLILMKKLVKGETDTDVLRAINSGLQNRLSNPTYMLKSDDVNYLNKAIVDIAASGSFLKIGSWEVRRLIVRVLGKVSTLESYRFLGSVLEAESDNDVINAIKASMNAIKEKL